MIFDFSMLYLIVPLVAGALVGYFLRHKKSVNLSKLTLGVIVTLIFSLGFSIGSNKELLESMPRVGWTAFVMAILAIAFSVLLVELAIRKVKID